MLTGTPTDIYNCIEWLKLKTDDYSTHQVDARAGERILGYDIVYNFTSNVLLNSTLYEAKEFNQNTFPLPLICLPYMIVELVSSGSFMAIKINNETIREALRTTEFCSPKHRVINGHLRPTKSWYVTRENFFNVLENQQQIMRL